VVCGDDFGISPGVDDAILELVEARKLSAVSCLTGYPEWNSSARRLERLSSECDLGLHIAIPWASRRREIAAAIARQFEKYEDALGKSPDFVDGHRHIHEHPVVGTLLLEYLGARGLSPYLRNTHEAFATIAGRKIAMVKTTSLSLVGKIWRRRVERAGFSTNDGFLGVYDWETEKAETVFARFAANVTGSRPLWMVHPGYPDALLRRRDAFVSGRENERMVLIGDFFVRWGVEPARFERALTNPQRPFVGPVGAHVQV